MSKIDLRVLLMVCLDRTAEQDVLQQARLRDQKEISQHLDGAEQLALSVTR